MKKDAGNIFFVLSYLFSKRAGLLLFCFSFIYAFFLLQGSPFFMHGDDDFFMAWAAMQASWGELLCSTFFERVFLQGGNIGYTSIGERGAYFIFYKLLIVFDGMRFPDINYLFRAFLFSSVGVLIYKLLEEFKVSKIFSISASLLYITSVPSYSILKFIGDTTVYYHFFMLLCYYLFFTKYLKQDKTNPFLISIAIFISGLFALKSKQIAIILPVVLFIYCIFVKQNICGVLKRRIPVFSIALLYYIPLPFSVLGQATESALENNNFLLNFRTYYWYNPWTNIGVGEQLPAILSPFNSYIVTAGSLFGNYKFFFGWLVIFFIICFSLTLYQSLRKHEKLEWRHVLFFLLLWHTLEVGIMSFYFRTGLFHAVRYVGIALPSFILITFFSLQKGFEHAAKTFLARWKKTLLWFFVLFIIPTILSNAHASAIQIRGAEISQHVLIHDSIAVVYKDYFKKTEVDDTIFFRIFPDMVKNVKEKELSEILFTDIAPQFGVNYDGTDTEIAKIKKKLKEKGYVYVATFRPEIPFINKKIIAKLSACPDTSFYCSLKEMIRGEARQFYVYKVFK